MTKILFNTHTNFCCLFCSLIMRTCYAFMTCQLCFYYVKFSLEKLHVCLLILSEIWGCEDRRQLTPPMQSTACTTYYLFIFALVHAASGNRYGLLCLFFLSTFTNELWNMQIWKYQINAIFLGDISAKTECNYDEK